MPDTVAAPRISVVIATVDRPAAFRRALASIRRQTLPADACEVIVVDAATSPEASARNALAAREDGAVYVSRPGAGVSEARNAGMAAAGSPFIVDMDDDAEAMPEWLESLLSAFKAHPEAACVGGPIRLAFEEGVRRPSWLPVLLESYMGASDHGHVLRSLLPGEVLFGSNMARRTSWMRQNGGFAMWGGYVGRQLMTNEDITLQMLMVRAGLERRYEPGAVVIHYVSAERLRLSWFLRRTFWQGVSDVLAVRRGVAVRQPLRRLRRALHGPPQAWCVLLLCALSKLAGKAAAFAGLAGRRPEKKS